MSFGDELRVGMSRGEESAAEGAGGGDEKRREEDARQGDQEQAVRTQGRRVLL